MRRVLAFVVCVCAVLLASTGTALAAPQPLPPRLAFENSLLAVITQAQVERAQAKSVLNAIASDQAEVTTLEQRYAGLLAKANQLQNEVSTDRSTLQQQTLKLRALVIDEYTGEYSTAYTGPAWLSVMGDSSTQGAFRAYMEGYSLQVEENQYFKARTRLSETLQAVRDIAAKEASAESWITTEEHLLSEEEAQLPELADVLHAGDPSVQGVEALLPVKGTDIPQIVFATYVYAAWAAQRIDPGCGIQWWELAGIGQVESNQGRFGNTQIEPNGEVSPPILGPVLDGKHGFAAIPAPNGQGWARAEGPGQFLPQTFLGVAMRHQIQLWDPENLWQSSLAMALTLCDSGQGAVAVSPAAIFSYNHSQSYVAQVVAWADLFQKLGPQGPIPPPEPPAGVLPPGVPLPDVPGST